jgi:hypothetical protein
MPEAKLLHNSLIDASNQTDQEIAAKSTLVGQIGCK